MPTLLVWGAASESDPSSNHGFLSDSRMLFSYQGSRISYIGACCNKVCLYSSARLDSPAAKGVYGKKGVWFHS